ncbi:hypothetical protein HK100_012315 [Physocladia obscura]|uniref:Uncharacterized protein n=1 Tax=Physocladia obscura TaxID=109957 RepID=A0AAD5XHQ8_9FUNG|nr:hypothetical protein HK100_012315 [Physocladia obscura]
MTEFLKREASPRTTFAIRKDGDKVWGREWVGAREGKGEVEEAAERTQLRRSRESELTQKTATTAQTLCSPGPSRVLTATPIAHITSTTPALNTSTTVTTTALKPPAKSPISPRPSFSYTPALSRSSMRVVDLNHTDPDPDPECSSASTTTLSMSIRSPAPSQESSVFGMQPKPKSHPNSPPHLADTMLNRPQQWLLAGAAAVSPNFSPILNNQSLTPVVIPFPDNQSGAEIVPRIPVSFAESHNAPNSLVVYLDPDNTPEYFHTPLPEFLGGKIAVATYTTRLHELNRILSTASSLCDYGPIYRLSSVAALITWTATVTALSSIRFTTDFATSWGFVDSVGVLIAFIVGCVAIYSVKVAFSKKSFEYLEPLKYLMRKYTLIDAHHHLVWQLHVTTAFRMPSSPSTADINFLRQLQDMGECGVGEDSFVVPSMGVRPVRPTIWFSVEEHEFEVVVDRRAGSRGGFVIRPPRTDRSPHAQHHQSSADFDQQKSREENHEFINTEVDSRRWDNNDAVGGEDDNDDDEGMISVYEWTKKVPDVVAGVDLRPVSVVIESILESDGDYSSLRSKRTDEYPRLGRGRL